MRGEKRREKRSEKSRVDAEKRGGGEVGRTTIKIEMKCELMQ